MTEPAAAAPGSEGGEHDRVRRWAPLASLVVPLLLAALVLPSALNVDQSNPSPTLEYAPVPPSSDDPPPAIGNLSTLALARTTGLRSTGDGAGDGGGGGLPPQIPPVLDELVKRVASSKTCVGDPPRQTEDPTSPPCVAAFKGSNGGATYPGVTKTEVRVLIYTICCGGKEGTYYDLARPPKQGESEAGVVTAARVWQQYFNQRFQTYNRFVHLFLYPATGQSEEAHRADAARNYADIKPFAVMMSAQDPESYIDEMARRGVVSFTGGLDGSQFVGQQIYSEVKPLAWGNYASAELKARLYADYVCTELNGRPTSFNNVPGQPRKFGLWFSVDPRFQEVTRFSEFVAGLLESTCGIRPIAHSYPQTHYAAGSKSAQQAAAAVADWQRNGVTTILHVGGIEADLSQAAQAAQYYPEIVVAGDHFWEANASPQGQAQAVFKNAVLLTDVPSFLRREDTYCIQAYRDTSPRGAGDGEACYLYYPLLQVFTGIQTAGPKLTPQAMDKGLHAIPAVASKDPTIPACFYFPGDYTCTKDVTVQYWDPVKRAERVTPDQGYCWRMVDKGARFVPGGFPRRDQLAGVNRAAGQGQCNNSTNAPLVLY